MMKNGNVLLPNTMANDRDDVALTTKKLKPSTKKSTNLDDSISSITSIDKKSKSKSIGDDSMSSITSKSKKKKDKSVVADGNSAASLSLEKKGKKSTSGNSTLSKSAHNMDTNGAFTPSMMSLNHASYASLHSKYVDDDDSDDDYNTQQFMTPRQCLTPPPDTLLNGNKLKQVGTKDRQQIMAPVSPSRPVPQKQHRVGIPESTATKKKKGSKPKVDLNRSCPILFNPDESEKRSNHNNKQSKKVAIPNPKEPAKVKTTFLEDCSDSSDSEHEKERKRMRKEKKKKEREDALKEAQKVEAAAQEPKYRRRSSIGPTVVPVLVPKVTTNRSISKHHVHSKESVVSRRRTNNRQSDAIYCKYHHRAATTIAAVVRGHLARMQYQICQLQQQLDQMSRRTEDDIAEVYVTLEISKQEWECRAHERFQKNIQRGDKTLNVHEAQDLIHKIRNENTDFRERNAQLLSDVQKLRINNERLEQANKESNEFTNRLLYHQEVIEVEHAKLMKVHTQYEESVHKHEEHLNLHIAHGECETKARNMYGRVIGLILDMMESTYQKRDEQLISDLYEMVEVLESEYDVRIERGGALVDHMADGTKDKKSKKSKKKGT